MSWECKLLALVVGITILCSVSNDAPFWGAETECILLVPLIIQSHFEVISHEKNEWPIHTKNNTLTSTPTHNIILFIVSMHCHSDICHLKAATWSSLKQNGFWLPAIAFIIHQLEKLILKGIPINETALLCCYRYSCSLDSSIFKFKLIFIVIVIILTVNGS